MNARRVGITLRVGLVVVAVGLVAFVACSGPDDPTTTTPSGPVPSGAVPSGTTPASTPATTVPTTSSTPPPTSQPPITITPPTTRPGGTVVPPPAPPVTVMPPTTKPPTGAADIPGLVVADGDGVRVVDDGRVVATFVRGAPAALAVPDLDGGVVYQGPVRNPTGMEWSEELDRNVFLWADGPPEPILRVREAGGVAEVLVAHADARLTLVDVVRLDGRSVVLYRMYIGGPQQEPVWDIVFEWLCTHDLETGDERCLGLIGSYESSYVEVRCGGELAVATFDAYGESPGTTIGVVPASLLEQDVDKEWLPTLLYDKLLYGPGTECVGPAWCNAWAIATVASDGSRVAWVQGGAEWDAGGEVTARPVLLVLLDPVTGRELSRLPLGVVSAPEPVFGERASFIDDDGTFVVVSGVGVDGPALVVAPDGSIVNVAGAGSTVSFWE